MDMETLKKKLERKEYQLWAAFDEFEMLAAWVTRVEQYPQAKICELQFCGGRDIQKWFDAGLDVIEAWAESLGCDRTDITGRDGWERMAAKRGYTRRFVTIEKVL